MTDDIDWDAAATRQADYLTGKLVNAWNDPNMSADLKRVMRRIANSIPTTDQQVLADAITALRQRADQASADPAERDIDPDEVARMIREHAVREQLPVDEIVGLIVPVDEWDNGFYLYPSGAYVVYANGDTNELDLSGTSLEDDLTDVYGRCGGKAAWWIRLNNGEYGGNHEYEDTEDGAAIELGVKQKH